MNNKDFTKFYAFLDKHKDDNNYSTLKIAVEDLKKCYPCDVSYYFGQIEGMFKMMYVFDMITVDEIAELLGELYGVDYEWGD